MSSDVESTINRFKEVSKNRKFKDVLLIGIDEDFYMYIISSHYNAESRLNLLKHAQNNIEELVD